MNKIQIAVLSQKLALLIKEEKIIEAERIALQLLKFTPKDAELLLSLAKLYEQKSSFTKSAELYFQLSELDVPDTTKYHALEKAISICHKHEQYKLGLACSESLLKHKPNDIDTIYFHGLFCYQTKYLLKAVACFSRVIELHKNDASLLYMLGQCYSQMGQSDKALPNFQKSLKLDPSFLHSRTSSLFSYNYAPILSEEVVSKAHKECGRVIENNWPETQFEKSKIGTKNLRIGYLSPCFYWHSVGYFIKAAMEGSHRDNFEIYCYSDVSNPDQMTELIKSNSDHWIDTQNFSDQQVVEKIKEDKIDILVDLTGYNKGSRMDVFAQKAAPIQATYLGYPNTTGLNRIDYRLTDHWADPGELDHYYSENLLRLESGFLCYYPDDASPLVSTLPAETNNAGICFGSFNAFPKVTDQVIKLWSELLVRIENSSLLVKAGPLHDIEFCNWLYDRFESEGVKRERVELLGWTPDKESHLKLYDKVDIHLDTFPYNGTTTTCEALWQGVPTITLAGSAHRERVGLSILSQLGLEDFIAHSKSSYVDIAEKMANDLAKLRSLRSEMRERMQNSPLMNVERFSKELSDAYRLMHQRYIET